MKGRLLLLLLSTLLGLGVIEGLCRLLEPRPADASEIEMPAKAPGVYRVLVLGGSTSQGIPVPELGFAAQLEALLRRAAPERELELVNLGKGGATSTDVRRRAAHGLAHYQLDLLIVLTAHNEFLYLGGEVSTLRRTGDFARKHLASVRLLASLFESARTRDLMPERMVTVDRDAPLFRKRLARYRENLAAIADSARAYGVPLVILTGPANLAQWPPVHRGIAWSRADPEHYEADVERAQALVDSGELDAASELLRALRVLYGEDAMFLYLEGRVAARRGHAAEAREHFMRAKELDPLPWRALLVQNDDIRALGEREDVTVVDVAAAFAAHAEDGLVGFALVGDNAHPTPLGNAIIAGDVARAMARAGLFLDVEAADAIKPGEMLLLRYRQGIGEPAFQRLEHRRLLEEGIYCMKTPFYYYRAARTHLEAGLALGPEDWVDRGNLGALLLLEGDTDAGLRELRRAAELLGRSLAPGDTEQVPYLEIALSRAGLSLDSLR